MIQCKKRNENRGKIDMEEQGGKKYSIIYYLILLFVGIFYYFFLGEKGYILGNDSTTFMDNEVPGYWLYISFLDMCEHIWGFPSYLEVVHIIQGVFALVVSMVVAIYIQNRFQLKKSETVLVYIATFLPYGYSLPQNVATHYILTEGLSYSLFHLFLLFLFMVFLDNKIKMMIPAAVMVILLIGTRSQLMLLGVVYIILILFLTGRWLYRKMNSSRRKLLISFSILISIIVILSIPYLMKMIVRTDFMPQFIHAMSGRALCTIEEQDIDGMEDKYKGAAQYIYKQIDANGYREAHFREGLRRWEDILESTNENTIFISKWFHEYCDKMEIDEEQRSEIDGIRYYLTGYLFDRHFDSYIEMTGWLCVQSFVAGIFIHPDAIYTLCHIIALGIYLLASVLLLVNKKVRLNPHARMPMILTGFVLVANVVITNLFFFGQQRYVVYTFGFFYISLYILLRDTVIHFIDKVRTCS